MSTVWAFCTNSYRAVPAEGVMCWSTATLLEAGNALVNGRIPPSSRLSSLHRLTSVADFSRADGQTGPYFVKITSAALVIGIGTSKTPSQTSTDSIVCVPWMTPFVLPSKVWPANVTPDVDR